MTTTTTKKTVVLRCLHTPNKWRGSCSNNSDVFYSTKNGSFPSVVID